MGTRARINIIEDDAILVSIYRQYDGYPDGLGQEVADFAASMTVVNGISGGKPKNQANGMGCFAAQLIAHLKDGVGNVYIRNTEPQSHGEEFVYNVSWNDKAIVIEALGGCMTAFGCAGDDADEMSQLYKGTAQDFKVKEEEEVA